MILAIVGPTGVGKTNLSIHLAKKYKGIIINADAMQVYKGLDIGTAKIKEKEKENIPHYLLDIVDVRKNYTVYHYQQDVRKILEEQKDKTIIFVGGTGLYLKAALYDYRFKEENNHQDLSHYTNEQLYEKCKAKDPLCNIHPHNRRRMERFLCRENNEIVPPKELYKVKFIGLTTKREKLYNIINERVDKMIAEGLEKEVKFFYENKIESKALQTAIGYKEFYRYFKKELTYEECIEEIKKNSRHYAKRQYTFFRHQLPVKWFDVNYDYFEKTIEEVIEYIEKE